MTRDIAPSSAQPGDGRSTSSAIASGNGGVASGASQEDLALLAALRAGDEAAFTALVRRYTPAMLRVALMYVRDRAVAEEVVQDAWLGVLHGLDSFEPRASLKAWIFRIVVNRAKTSALREGRSIPFSAAASADDVSDEPAVAPERFRTEDSASGPAGWWSAPPGDWGRTPEELLLAAETRRYLDQAIAMLPPQQREVITLRDVEGLSASEVCNILGITEINQRVLLHRARSKVRQALERYFTQER